MANTIGRAIRNNVVDSGIVGQRVYRDLAPEDADMPFVVFYENIARSRELVGDGNSTFAVKQMAQVSLFQLADNENDSLVADLVSSLDNADLTGSDKRVLSCCVENVARLYHEEDETVNQAITLNITYIA